MKTKQTKPQKAADGSKVTSGVSTIRDYPGAQAAALKAIAFTKADLPEKPPTDKWHSHKEENWAAIAELDKLVLAKDLEGLRGFRSPSD